MAARKSEMMDAIEALAKAKDISVDQIVSAVEEGCKAAYRKYEKRGANSPMNLSVVISREHDVQIFARKVVVETVSDESQQISLEDARRLRPNYELGDIVETDVTPADFGRVAAQTAKQVMLQRLRELERGKIYDEYIEKENEILHRHRGAGGAQGRVCGAGPHRGRAGKQRIYARGGIPPRRSHQGVRSAGVPQRQGSGPRAPGDGEPHSSRLGEAPV